MEEELGSKLFERIGRRLILTQEGKLLQQRAESLLHQFNDTIAELKDIHQGTRGTLSIGSVFSCVFLLPEKIRRFRQKYPDATLRIVEGDHILLGEQLEKRNVELVVSRLK